MNPFQAHRKREKQITDLSELAKQAQEKEKAERETACYNEITEVLLKHRCEINPQLRMTPFGILPDVVITALDPKPTNDRSTKTSAYFSGAASTAPSKEVPQTPAQA